MEHQLLITKARQGRINALRSIKSEPHDTVTRHNRTARRVRTCFRSIRPQAEQVTIDRLFHRYGNMKLAA